MNNVNKGTLYIYFNSTNSAAIVIAKLIKNVWSMFNILERYKRFMGIIIQQVALCRNNKLLGNFTLNANENVKAFNIPKSNSDSVDQVQGYQFTLKLILCDIILLLPNAFNFRNDFSRLSLG